MNTWTQESKLHPAARKFFNKNHKQLHAVSIQNRNPKWTQGWLLQACARHS